MSCYHSVLIVGPNHDISDEIVQIYSRSNFLKIGDGIKNINLEDLHCLKDRIDYNTRIDFLFHGGKNCSYNSIKTSNFLQYLDQLTTSPLYIHLWLCYSGSATKEIKHLKNRSVLIIHSQDNYSYIQDCNQDLRSTFVCKRKNFVSQGPYKDFMSNIVLENHQIISFNTIIDKKSYQFDIDLTDSILNKKKCVHLKHQINKFLVFYKQQPFSRHKSLNLRPFSIHHISSLMLEAVCKGYTVIVELLLKHGANIEHQDKYGNTPLITAVIWQKINLIKILLKHGANIEHSDNFGDTALIRSVGLNNLKAIRLLLRYGVNIEHENNNGVTALLKATSKSSRVLDVLLKHGANIEHQDKNGRTALLTASFYNYPKSVKLLLKQSANIEHQESSGNTALMEASSRGHVEIVKSLLKYGANIEHQNWCGNTALIEASSGGHVEIVKSLLKYGANIEHQNWCGNTAMMLAYKKNYNNILRLLLEKNSKYFLTRLSIKNDNGYSPRLS